MFKNLQIDLNVLSWFKINSLKANPGKLQFMALRTNENDSFFLNIGQTKSKAQLNSHYWELKLTRS